MFIRLQPNEKDAMLYMIPSPLHRPQVVASRTRARCDRIVQQQHAYTANLQLTDCDVAEMTNIVPDEGPSNISYLASGVTREKYHCRVVCPVKAKRTPFIYNNVRVVSKLFDASKPRTQHSVGCLPSIHFAVT